MEKISLGIDNMYINKKGEVFYKNKYVEQINTKYAFETFSLSYINEIKNRCEYLKKNKIVINFENVTWKFDKYYKN